MEKVKKLIPATIMSFLFIIVFNVLAFILAGDLDQNFWCGYIFISVSWLCLLGSELMIAWRHDSGRALFLNAPGILVSLIHLGVQTVLGVAVMAIPFFSAKAAMCFEIVVLAVYFAIMVALEIYKSKSRQ